MSHGGQVALEVLYGKSISMLFKVFDSSNSGHISRVDVVKVISAFGQTMSEKELDLLIADLDLNANGSIDFAEFQKLIKTMSEDHAQPLLPLEKLVQRLVLNEDVVSRTLRIRTKRGFLCDMDGVIYRGGSLIDGVERFLAWIKDTGRSFIFITNNSKHTPEFISNKLKNYGLDISSDIIYTAAMACAEFIISQKPHHCTAYCLGDVGMEVALKENGITLTSTNPDYVVVAESDNYTVEQVNLAASLVMKGAKLIGASPDPYDRMDDGIEAGCGAWSALIEKATGKKAYFTGKPNPWMMQSALRRLGVSVDDACMVGDRMDTDIIGGLESRLDPVLVLSGVTLEKEIPDYAWRPYLVFNNVGEIPPEDYKFVPVLKK